MLPSPLPTRWPGARPARLAAVAAMLTVAACARPDPPTGIVDRHEARNRSVHERNIAADRAFWRPVSQAYGRTVPPPVRRGINNFAGNLSLPQAVVNNLLQVRPGDAAQNATRFVVNSTIGVLGVFDPATAMGAPAIETDFGETLFVWGVPEGNYVEHPVFGPSTERDTFGNLVDFFTDPLGFLTFAQEARWGLASVGIVSAIDARYENAGLIDSVLYESADSYAQTRQAYLDNRRFRLGRGAEPDYFDPYEDPYADPTGR